mmetsp:Transcript_64947/g.154959  ORF Transcript_64947/g.154959 Transcript_64947/m.154959 type:complete len:625 (-) Transcript_64947:293-2167(-)
MATNQFVIRDNQNGCSIRKAVLPGESSYTLPPIDAASSLCKSNLDASYSSDGSALLVIESDTGKVNVYDTKTGAVKASFTASAAIASFSPSGTYIQTWERLNDTLQASGGNLRVWNAATGEFVAGFGQKKFSRDEWPYVRWTSDENIACLQVSTGVHLFSGHDLNKGVIGKIAQDKPGTLSVSPGPPPYKIATFVPEIKDQPAVARLYSYPNLSESVASKKMFRAQDASFLWSPTGEAVLVRITTDVDATGKSYYGESTLTFLSADGKLDGNVALGKEGPIHDVAWSPSGKEFVVVYGFMPAKATLFDTKCKAIFDFGTGSRNTIAWAPHGRFLVLGGFGNIAGHIEFWDNNRKKSIASIKAPASTSWAWSPCSRFFLTSTLFPRLRVDNGFKIHKYDGTFIHEEKCPGEVYQIAWKPAAAGVFPDRPASAGAGNSAAANGSNGGGAPAAPSAYVPPHLRGKAGAGSAPARPAFSLHDYEQAKKVGGTSALGKALPPGAEEEDDKLSKGALKKKKAKEKAAREKDAADALEQTNAALEAAGIEIKPAGAAKAPVVAEVTKDLETPEGVQKRLKAVQKKLRQTQDLAKEAAGGKELNVDQLAKVDMIPAVEKEIAQLEKLFKSLS